MMELIYVFLAIFFFLLVRSLWKIYVSEPISTPSFIDYLPGGTIFPMLRDVGASSRVILDICKKYGNVGQFWLGPTHTTYTSVPEDVVHILNSNHIFVRPRGLTTVFKTVAPAGLLVKSGQEHRNARLKLQKHFTPSMVKGFHPKILESISELTEKLINQCGPSSHNSSKPVVIDITEEVIHATIRIMTTAAFGFQMSADEQIALSKLINDLQDELYAEFLGYPIRQMLSIFGIRKKFFQIYGDLKTINTRLIEKRLNETLEQKNSRPADVLDAILAMSNGDMSEILSHTIEFVVAGSHTSSVTVAWAIYELCINPSIAAKLEEEIEQHFAERPASDIISVEDIEKMTYLKYIWKETLRLHPPGPFMMRRAVADTTLQGSGVKISEGTIIMICNIAIHQDPALWSEPKTFKPERWCKEMEDVDKGRSTPGAYIPFSLGPRVCPGRFLAEYEGMVILLHLYRRFKFQLACRPEEVVSRTAFTENGKYSSKHNDNFDMGIPVTIQLRS